MQGAYYTDPRVAGYMHETFGMNFTDNFEVAEMYVERSYSKTTRPYKIHISSDSIHLLQPHPSDLLQKATSENLKFPDTVFRSTVALKIIQRDSKPFFWPEWE